MVVIVQNIMFETQAEADAYIKEINKPQEEYDVNPSRHTKVDEALDAWAKKAEKLFSKWTYPEVRQDLMQELASIRFMGDKGFMISDPTSRFNRIFLAFDAVERSTYKSINDSKYYYKNGQKQPLNREGEDGGDSRSVYSLWMKIGVVPVIREQRLKQRGLDRVGMAYVSQDLEGLKEFPKLREQYLKTLASELDKVPFRDRLDLMLRATKEFGLQRVVGAEKFLEERASSAYRYIWNMNRKTKNITKSEREKAELILFIADCLPRMEKGKEDCWAVLRPLKEDSSEVKQAKVKALFLMSNKGYPSAQSVLAEYYEGQGDLKKADLQLRRLSDNEFVSDEKQDKARQKRNEIRSQLNVQRDLTKRLEKLDRSPNSHNPYRGRSG